MPGRHAFHLLAHSTAAWPPMLSPDQHCRRPAFWWRARPFLAPSLAVLLVFVFPAVTATFRISFTQWRDPRVLSHILPREDPEPFLARPVAGPPLFEDYVAFQDIVNEELDLVLLRGKPVHDAVLSMKRRIEFEVVTPTR